MPSDLRNMTFFSDAFILKTLSYLSLLQQQEELLEGDLKGVQGRPADTNISAQGSRFWTF